MKKILNILFLTETFSLSCMPMTGCEQKVKFSDNLTSSLVPKVHNPLNRWALGNIVKKISDIKTHLILVQEFGKKNVVINAIKSTFSYKPILRYNAMFYEELDLYDPNSNILINLKNQSLIKDSTSFRVKAVLKINDEKKFVSFNIRVVSKQTKYMLEAEQKLNEKNIEIYVKKFKNKELIIDAIKKLPTYKQNITNNDIKLVDDFEFVDSSNSIIINDNEFWDGRIITVKAHLKFDKILWTIQFKVALIL